MIYIALFKPREKKKKKASLNSKYVTSNAFSLSFILILRSSLSKPKVLQENAGKDWLKRKPWLK